MIGWLWNKTSQQDLNDVRVRLRALEAASQQARGSRWEKWTSILGVMGFVASAVTVPILWHQNALLADQLDVQRQTLKISGPKLEGEAQVVLNVLHPGLFEPGTRGVELILSDGSIAERDTHWVRVGVTNSGMSAGAIASAGLLIDDTFLPATTLYCGVENEEVGWSLGECDMPLKVLSAEKEMFIFDIPLAGCGAFETSPRKITPYFISVTGTVEKMETEVLTSIVSYCPNFEEG